MKCIRCDRDCTYKERASGRCPHCGGKFGLEPRSSDKLTDAALLSAVKAVSSEGKVRWNLEHLYYEIRRRKGSNAPAVALGWGCGGFILPLPFTLPFGDPNVGLMIVSGTLLALAGFWKGKKTSRKTFPRDTFNREWSRWAEAHGIPDSMIVTKQQRPPGRPLSLESDLGDYSFDRAVVCDGPETVDLLVANNFHFENNCAVLTADGYPQQAFETVRSMLRRNPRLKVWVLHNATPAGCTLAQRLKGDPAWFEEGITIVDVGLRPSHAQPVHNLADPASPSASELERPGISVEEKAWLSKQGLALAAIRPEQVIKRLFRSFSSDLSSFDLVDGIYIDRISFSGDVSTSDGGGDSFG